MACRGFLQCLLKLFNLALALVGVLLLTFAATRKLAAALGAERGVSLLEIDTRDGASSIAAHDGASSGGGASVVAAPPQIELPRFWFIYLMIGVGAFLTLVTLVGAIAAETNSTFCLAFYQFGLCLLILFECVATALIWLEDVPVDPTGEYDTYQRYVLANQDRSRLAMAGLVLIEVAALLVAMMLRAAQDDASQAEDDDDYITGGMGRGMGGGAGGGFGGAGVGIGGGGGGGGDGGQGRLRQPLVYRGAYPTAPAYPTAVGAGVGGAVGSGGAGLGGVYHGAGASGVVGGGVGAAGQTHVPLTDAWRQRLLEKYGLDAHDFNYGPPPGHSQAAAPPPSAPRSSGCSMIAAMATLTVTAAAPVTSATRHRLLLRGSQRIVPFFCEAPNLRLSLPRSPPARRLAVSASSSSSADSSLDSSDSFSPTSTSAYATAPPLPHDFSPRPLPFDPQLLRGLKLIWAAEPAQGHHMEGHPESNERVVGVIKELQDSGLTEQGRPGELLHLSSFLPATPLDISAVHSPKYMRAFEQSMEAAADEGLVYLDGSGPTFATVTTFSDTLSACGAGLTLIDALVEAEKINPTAAPPAGFALVRPPGHHAVHSSAMGFCLVDHVAVAARYAQSKGLKRVFILDFDVHHGNGTHDLFYNDPDVFFMSTHQEGTYPGTGRLDEVGQGAGEGTTINIPLPGGAGDLAMAAVVDRLVAPAVARFKPDIILVSAGYDAHYLDPLASLQFRTSTYHRLGQQLSQLARQYCNGRLVFFLEGGYNVKALAGSVADTVRGVIGDDVMASGGLDVDEAIYEEPESRVDDVIEHCRSIHSL
ncbi:unnamed protein product [Closterium sp. NIES-64]|nr:unnamed protein product [Closterium sp. NIES-64]